MTVYPVKFSRIPHERIWGGSKLKEKFDVTIEAPVGEYWVLSAHPNGTSVAINGELAGKTLIELTEEFPEAYLGDSPQNRFPLLIKFIEATEDLSIQIHPNDQYAKIHEGDFGKTEAWYVLDCKEKGYVILGHRFRSREEYLAAVTEKRVKEYLIYKPIQKDQLIFVPSQSLHALLAGTVVIEIQQTSDVTYRVYDWDRMDYYGNPRELHTEKAGDVLKYNAKSLPEDPLGELVTVMTTNHLTHEHLVTCPYFSIDKLSINQAAYTMELGRIGNPDILIVAGGEGTLFYGEGNNSLQLKFGDTVLVPSNIWKYQIYAESAIMILRAYY